MRVDPDYAPPPAQSREASPPRQQPQDPGRPQRPRQGWALTPEKDPMDYDDGAWM